ncbi:unnamed protein product [Tetraodon nigroviridis]|uniref:(spotted green pufferfish) hypothetical protein n=1 Tax=Tetraodon nigroviridis TaxID=99883 RepID=Q4S8Q8_TETNG|nr:unnamed protein product [Tetraodon nigroviridis]
MAAQRVAEAAWRKPITHQHHPVVLHFLKEHRKPLKHTKQQQSSTSYDLRVSLKSGLSR